MDGSMEWDGWMDQLGSETRTLLDNFQEVHTIAVL